MSKYISAHISEEDKNRAMHLIEELRSILHFGIKLTKEQKDSMLSVDDGRIPFVEKALEYAKQEPKIVPPYANLNGYANDWKLFNDLSDIARELLSLIEIVTDSRMASGADAFEEARMIYKSAQGAAQASVPGTQSIVDELGKLFSGQGRSRKKYKEEQNED